MRTIVVSAITIALISGAPQIVHAKAAYTLQQYPEGFASPSVPCSAFKKIANGSWKEAAVFVFRGQRFTGNTYPPGSREASIIDQKCRAR